MYGIGIFTICFTYTLIIKNQPKCMGKYTGPMDPMGHFPFVCWHFKLWNMCVFFSKNCQGRVGAATLETRDGWRKEHLSGQGKYDSRLSQLHQTTYHYISFVIWLVVFHQPIWKICSSNWINLPKDLKINNIWNHHLVILVFQVDKTPLTKQHLEKLSGRQELNFDLHFSEIYGGFPLVTSFFHLVSSWSHLITSPPPPLRVIFLPLRLPLLKPGR